MGGAGSATTAATARESIPRLTAPFPAQLDFVPAPPPLGGEGDSTDGQGTPNVVSVHSFNNLIVLPSQQTGLPQLANLFCPVPVSVPVSVPASVQFQFQFQLRPALQLSLLLRYLRFLRSHHYSWINFKRSCAIIPTNQL